MNKKYKQTLTVFSFLFYAISLLITSNLNAANINPINKNTKQTAPIKIWGMLNSPYVRKVCVVCLEKNAPYRLEETLPATVLLSSNKKIPAEFEQASPLGKIPAIEDNGYMISDSAVIAAYLEKKYPNNPLYPADKESYARVLWFEKYVDDEMAKVSNKIFFERVVKPTALKTACNEDEVQNALQHELPLYLSYLEKAIKEGVWPKYEGRITIADIALASHFVSLKMSNVQLDAKRWPALIKHVEKILSRPSFVKMSPQK